MIDNRCVRTIGLSIGCLAIVAAIAGGCAKGGELVPGTGGAGGDSGTGGGASTSTGDPPSSSSGMSSTSSGMSSTSSGMASSSGMSSSSSGMSSSSSSSSSTSASSSGVMCAPPQHLCNGMCADNTVQTGCYGSVSCAPCPQSPANGVEICNAAGQCDFNCNAGYMKSGAGCVCATQCCADADCPAGSTCVGGSCQQQASCDQAVCAAFCIIQCMGFGIGLCVNNLCTCICA